MSQSVRILMDSTFEYFFDAIRCPKLYRADKWYCTIICSANSAHEANTRRTKETGKKKERGLGYLGSNDNYPARQMSKLILTGKSTRERRTLDSIEHVGWKVDRNLN